MDEYLTEESALHNLNSMLTEERNGYKDLDKVSIRELQAAPVGSLVKVKLPGAYGKLVDGVNAYKKTGEDEYTVLGDDGKEDEQFDKLTSSDLYWDLGNLDELGQYTITAPEIKYVILDKHGRQRSAPNADDGELWDRVDSMDPRGDKGLHVVVFNEDLDEDYNKIAAERLNKKFKKEFPIGKELTTNDGEKFFVAKYLNKNKFTGMQTAYVLPIEYKYDARTGLKLEAGKQFDVISYLNDYQDDDQLIEKIVKQGSKYQVQSEKGRNMGTYDTKGEAEDRLKQVEMFKHMNEELTEAKYDADSNSYSIELEGSGDIDIKAIMKALGLEGNKSAGVMNTDGHINIYWNEKPEDTSFNYSKGNSKGTHHLSEYRDPREDLELLQRVPGVEWVYIDYPGEDVVEWEIEDEALNEDRKSDIEATLLDDEPSFADYMRDMYGMDIFDDPIAENPDVEDYYLDEYENYLDHLYDLDNDSNYDADHAAEWMERNPHGYYNDENDYGVDAEEDDTDPEQFLDAYELRRDMSDEEAKAQIKKVFDDDLKAGMIGQEDYDRGTKEVYDYWQKLHTTNEGLTEAVNSNLTDKEILDKCFIDTVTGSGPRIRIKVPYKMLSAYNVNLILDTFSNWIEEVLGNTVQNKSVTIDKSFIYNICRFTSNLTNNGVYIDLPINWRKYNALSADEKNYFCEAIYSFVNDEFKFSLPPENNSNNESLTEAKNENYRVELYYYDNNKPDDVIYFENTKAAYNFCNNKISDNADYDDGLTGILVFNEAKDKLLNTWQNGSRGWENKSKALTEAVKPFVDDKVINSIRRYEMYHLPDSYIYADVDKAMRVDQVGTSSGEQPHDIIKATVCYMTQDNEEDYAEHKYKVFDDGRVEAISDESLNEAVDQWFIVKTPNGRMKDGSTKWWISVQRNGAGSKFDQTNVPTEVTTWGAHNERIVRVGRDRLMGIFDNKDQAIQTAKSIIDANDNFFSDLNESLDEAKEDDYKRIKFLKDELGYFAYSAARNPLSDEEEALKKKYENELRSLGKKYDLDVHWYVNESLDEAKNDTLNADIWDENKELRPEVKEKLELIVEKFKSALAEDKVDLDIKDIIIVGSNANYNYGDNSDIDLHIVADLSSFKGREKELAATVYNCFRRIFNDKFDPKIRGHEVELFVESSDDTISNEIITSEG